MELRDVHSVYFVRWAEAEPHRCTQTGIDVATLHNSAVLR